MSKEKRRVPKLRFPGFTEDWEQRKFGEIYERASQKNDLTYGIDKIISVANMYFKIDATVGSEEYLKTYNVFKLGDIAFEGHTNKEYSYGRFVENTIGDGIVSHIFDVFTPRINLDINFWKDLIKYEPIMGPILRRCTKASRMMSNLTSKEFLEEKILCPTLEEQKLIGEFIVRIDKNITLHQRKLEHLNLKKKALLQKLFPKNGERYPELRFPGFADAWEQRKLSDITEVVMGQSPSSKNYTDNPNDNILVQGNADLKDGKVVPRLWTKEITKTIDKDGIILTVRAPVGDVAKTDNKVVLGRGVAGIKGNDYIYQFLQKLQNNRYWVSLSSGSTFESINSNDIKDLIIDIPSIEEQTKISMLLNNVNSIITLHQRKLEHLQLQKKALLQQLFI